MQNKLLCVLVTCFLMVQGKIQNLCRPGSDAECARYGENMCCAQIKYTFNQDRQDFYACASRIGIENAGGKIKDEFGFSGTWKCMGATMNAYVSAVAFVTLAALF